VFLADKIHDIAKESIRQSFVMTDLCFFYPPGLLALAATKLAADKLKVDIKEQVHSLWNFPTRCLIVVRDFMCSLRNVEIFAHFFVLQFH